MNHPNREGWKGETGDVRTARWATVRGELPAVSNTPEVQEVQEVRFSGRVGAVGEGRTQC